mgnify:CR=1 FL=1
MASDCLKKAGTTDCTDFELLNLTDYFRFLATVYAVPVIAEDGSLVSSFTRRDSKLHHKKTGNVVVSLAFHHTH